MGGGRNITTFRVMNKICFVFAALLAAACAREEIVTVIPEPLSLEVGRGNFAMRQDVQITCSDSSLLKTAGIFAADMNKVLGIDIPAEVAGEGAVELALSEGLGNEEYRLEVTGSRISVTGGSSAGVFYGLQTVKQLLDDGRVPAVKIEDKPHFGYRGVHLDVARHFYTVDQVKTYIDILALHKMNMFHWHLTDDQGWRIEIRKHPRLTEVGSVRKETLIGHHSAPGPYKYDGIPHGGFYTQEQIREIVSYAADRHITIIPEIDLPGHMQAAVATYPQLGCTGGPYEMWCKWGISEDVLCAGNEKTYEFIEDVLDEVCELFPSELIHIGGDECPKAAWERCPECQAKIRELGLADKGSNKAEHYLQNYVMSRVEKYLNQKGRRIIGWDEILEGNASPTATIMEWRDHQYAVKAARRGNDVILTTRHYCYYDYCQTSDPESEPLCEYRRYISMKQAYRLDPYDRLFLHERERILGVQANLWTEYIADFDKVQHMLLPRLAALSETAWAYDRKDSYEDFAVRAKALLPALYRSYGYNYAPYFFNDME